MGLGIFGIVLWFAIKASHTPHHCYYSLDSCFVNTLQILPLICLSSTWMLLLAYTSLYWTSKLVQIIISTIQYSPGKLVRDLLCIVNLESLFSMSSLYPDNHDNLEQPDPSSNWKACQYEERIPAHSGKWTHFRSQRPKRLCDQGKWIWYVSRPSEPNFLKYG